MDRQIKKTEKEKATDRRTERTKVKIKSPHPCSYDNEVNYRYNYPERFQFLCNHNKHK